MKTITKVYDTYSNARNAVNELETAGVPISDISVLANGAADQEYRDANTEEDTEVVPGIGLGAVVGGAAGLMTGLGLMAIPGLGPVVAAGWLATTALGMVAGGTTGGIVGSLIDAGVPEEEAHVYSEAVRRGGTLVSVHTQDHNGAIVRSVLDKHTPLNPVEHGATYRDSGWRKFDPEGESYDAIKDRTDRERRSV